MISPLAFDTENKICVAGEIVLSMDAYGHQSWDREIEFGQTFQRIPAFAAALSRVDLKTDNKGHGLVRLYNFRVTNSSAKITIHGYQSYLTTVNWIACLYVKVA